jgi:hypothetical protein
MQEEDAKRRLAILRGEAPPPPAEAPLEPPARKDAENAAGPQSRKSGSTWERKKRKHAGEDDTEFELRMARERVAQQDASLAPARNSSSAAPLVNKDGHIDLFGDEKARMHAEKNEEAEREAAKKKRELEDQYTMRFSNAAGKAGLEKKPWYAADGAAMAPETFDPPSKDVWGNEDLGRKQREMDRLSSGDPLAMMKKGASKARGIRKAREKLQKEREAELSQLIKEERRKAKHERGEERRRKREEDGGRRVRRRDNERREGRSGERDSDRRRDRSASPRSDRERHHRRRDH